MPTHWAIDLGTSNTTICEDRSVRPHIVNLPDLAKLEPVTQTPVMPSCVCLMDGDGDKVLIGQEAVTYNWDGQVRVGPEARFHDAATRCASAVGRGSGGPN